MNPNPVTFWEWALENGVPGVLALACSVMAWVIWRMWARLDSLQEARVADMKAFIDVSDKLHDKAHKTANDLARVADVLLRERDRDHDFRRRTIP